MVAEQKLRPPLDHIRLPSCAMCGLFPNGLTPVTRSLWSLVFGARSALFCPPQPNAVVSFEGK